VIEATGFVLKGGESKGVSFTVFGQTIVERITSADSGGRYYIFDETTPSGLGVPPHRESREDEIVFVRAGEFEVFTNGTVTRVGPGAILNFARGTLHGFKCVSASPGETTWIVTPGENGQTFLRALGQFPPGSPDFAKLDALHKAHGIEMVPPSNPWW
jgi:quercetin dioxygenase-like cupin family protein